MIALKVYIFKGNCLYCISGNSLLCLSHCSVVCSLCVIIDRFTQFNRDSIGMNNGNLLNESALACVVRWLLVAPLLVNYSKSHRSIMSDNDLRRTRIECELRNRKLRVACMCSLLTLCIVVHSRSTYTFNLCL